MATKRKICSKSLQSHLDFVGLPLPNSAKFNRQAQNIFQTADKAGFLRQVYSIRLALFGDIQGRLASFVIHISQIFGLKCQTVTKICSSTYKVRPLQRRSLRKWLSPSYPSATRKSLADSSLLLMRNYSGLRRCFVCSCMQYRR